MPHKAHRFIEFTTEGCRERACRRNKSTIAFPCIMFTFQNKPIQNFQLHIFYSKNNLIVSSFATCWKRKKSMRSVTAVQRTYRRVCPNIHCIWDLKMMMMMVMTKMIMIIAVQRTYRTVCPSIHCIWDLDDYDNDNDQNYHGNDDDQVNILQGGLHKHPLHLHIWDLAMTMRMWMALTVTMTVMSMLITESCSPLHWRRRPQETLPVGVFVFVFVCVFVFVFVFVVVIT